MSESDTAVDRTDSCNECGQPLGAGYLCDDCDEVVVHA
jgi:hypothetical protein